MKQFSRAQLAQFSERLARQPGMLDVLGARIRPVREHYRIPETARASWAGFYACPKHSIALEFDITRPDVYRCPVDGELLMGEPYKGAWWRLLNDHNSNACHAAALRWMLTGDASDLELAGRILRDYAARYPGYEVHGGIPYNHPGKANAQTLCDAFWVRTLAVAYDIIRDALDAAARAFIEDNLLRCAADFLMEQRINQLHNHECIVSSAIGVIGALLEDSRYLEFALDTPYGLKNQLKLAVLTDGFWFEGTPSYHFYAMEQFIQFERFAVNAPYSFFRDPRFIDVLKFPLRLVHPDGLLPPLNDSGDGSRGFAGTENLYEFAYARTGDPDFARILGFAYQKKERLNNHSFFDGVDELPTIAPGELTNYHDESPGGSGLTVLHGSNDRYLLFKHSPYGGEHDHYDRLNIHLLGLGRSAAPDIGTCPYGAPLHYAYYKNTAAHNTVCLDGENQPPADCRVTRFERKDCITVIEAETCWDGSYRMLDSFTMPQWSLEAYQGARFRRHIVWHDDFVIDCFDVCVPKPHRIDLALHVRGERARSPEDTFYAESWAEYGAGQYLHDVWKTNAADSIVKTRWNLGDGVILEGFTALSNGIECFHMLSPDNPSVSERSCMIQRKVGTSARFVSVLSVCGASEPIVASVGMADENLTDVGISGGLIIERSDGRIVRWACPPPLA